MDTEKFYEQAFKQAEQNEGRVIKDVHRGEVWYYTFTKAETGSEQSGDSGRPCVIVSNESNNHFSPTVTVIPLTTKDKKPLPTHVYVDIGAVSGTALCEQILTISKERLRDYNGEIDFKTQKEIDKALSVQLALAEKKAEAKPEEIKPAPPVPVMQDKELIQQLQEADNKLKVIERERDTYKELYNNLLEKLIERG